MVSGSMARYSAKAPSCWKPAVSRLSQNLGSSLFLVRFVSPHPLQLPHEFLKLSAPTLSPTFQSPPQLAPT